MGRRQQANTKLIDFEVVAHCRRQLAQVSRAISAIDFYQLPACEIRNIETGSRPKKSLEIHI